MELETSWGVIPERGARLYLGPLVIENLVATNMDIRRQGGIEFAGACISNTVFRNMSEETRGIVFFGTQGERGPEAPCYFNSATRNDVYFGGTMGCAALRSNGASQSVLAYGNIFYDCTVNDSQWLPQRVINHARLRGDLTLGSGGIWFLDLGTLEGQTITSAVVSNAIRSCRSNGAASGAGIYVGHGVLNTLIGRTITYGCPVGLKDFGKGTSREWWSK